MMKLTNAQKRMADQAVRGIAKYERQLAELFADKLEEAPPRATVIALKAFADAYGADWRWCQRLYRTAMAYREAGWKDAPWAAHVALADDPGALVDGMTVEAAILAAPLRTTAPMKRHDARKKTRKAKLAAMASLGRSMMLQPEETYTTEDVEAMEADVETLEAVLMVVVKDIAREGAMV